jgi:putative transposase
MSLAETSDARRDIALERWRALRPHLEDGVPLTRAARFAGVPKRTAQRWLMSYRRGGLAGLAPHARADRGTRQMPEELVAIIEGLALGRPAPSVAHVHRQVSTIALSRGWRVPSYATVRSIVLGIDPGLMTRAHEGPERYRDRYELVYRHEAGQANGIWQADHTELDLVVLDDNGQSARPWLTVIIDDFSRSVCGYTVNLTAPSALQTALALRQAIWRKTDLTWPVCGIPDVLYSDHGSDFVSRHLEQVAADLKIRLINSTVAVPQGRGKIERIFGTINTELLVTLPGYLGPSGSRPPAPAPQLTLTELDVAIALWLAEYHARPHSETTEAPVSRWAAGGWLPRMPKSVAQLDLLLLTVAKPRIVHRDGIRFLNSRYLDLALAAYVTEPVTIRYDPRDIGQIRVYHHDQFICNAVSPDFADRTISLRELQTARTARRREINSQLKARLSLVEEIRPSNPQPGRRPPPEAAPPPRSGSLRRYREDLDGDC